MNALQRVSKKYAIAFYTINASKISRDTIQNIESLLHFLLQHKQFMYFLTWPVIEEEIKKNALYKIIDSFGLPLSFKKLVDVLIVQKRSFLICEIFKQFVMYYKKQNNLLDVTITSSVPLEKNEIDALIVFFKKITGATILYKNRIDKNLIAGIRLQSDTYLWEHSINNQLCNMERSFIR